MDSKIVPSKPYAVRYPNPSSGEPTKAQLLVIAVREIVPAILSEIPGVKTIVTVQKEIEASIKENRLGAVLSEMDNRIEGVELAIAALRSDGADKAVQVFTAGFGFIAEDPLAGSKTAEYANIILRYMVKLESLSKAIEVLDSLRRMSDEDLKIFCLFRKGGAIRPQFHIWEIMGGWDQAGLNQADLRDQTFARMNEHYPNVVRLESFGLLYRPDFAAQAGKQFPDIGPLRPEINRVAILTNLGRRTLEAIS